MGSVHVVGNYARGGGFDLSMSGLSDDDINRVLAVVREIMERRFPTAEKKP